MKSEEILQLKETIKELIKSKNKEDNILASRLMCDNFIYSDLYDIYENIFKEEKPYNLVVRGTLLDGEIITFVYGLNMTYCSPYLRTGPDYEI